MKLLVTGGAGFIGSNFVRYWRRIHPQDEIVVIDKLTQTGRKENLAEALGEVTFIVGDIAKAEDVAKVMPGIETIVHFAAEALVDRSLANPEAFVYSNVVGTFNLLEEARKNNIRFHHISTDEVLGQLSLESTEKWNEESKYDPRSPYSATKAASDHLVRSYFYSYGLPVTISNCANNIGPFMSPERLIPRAICRILSDQTVPVYTPGNQVREWLHVEDHCTAINAILEKGKIGDTYFIAPDNEEFSNLEVIKMLLGIMKVPESKIEFVADRPGHDQKYALNHTKITSELGWKPKHDLHSTLESMVTWFTENRNWWAKDFEQSEKIYNLKRPTA